MQQQCQDTVWEDISSGDSFSHGGVIIPLNEEGRGIKYLPALGEFCNWR